MRQAVGLILCATTQIMLVGCTCRTALRETNVEPKTAVAPEPYRPLEFATFRFEFHPEGGTIADIPREIRDQDGKKICIDGVMSPMDWADPTSKFALVEREPPDRLPAPGVQAAIICRTAGSPVSFSHKRVRVCGTFRINLRREEDLAVELFGIDVDSVSSTR
jgi:hypothetical protein